MVDRPYCEACRRPFADDNDADPEAISMRISGEGMARWGLAAVANNDRLYDAEAAISAFHDALLAVARAAHRPALKLVGDQ